MSLPPSAFIPKDADAAYTMYYAKTEIFEMGKDVSTLRGTKSFYWPQLDALDRMLTQDGKRLHLKVTVYGPEDVVLEFRKTN